MLEQIGWYPSMMGNAFQFHPMASMAYKFRGAVGVEKLIVEHCSLRALYQVLAPILFNDCTLAFFLIFGA